MLSSRTGRDVNMRTTHSRVLDEILSGKATEDAITEIHEYLTLIGNDLRDGKIDLDDLVVFKVSLKILILRKDQMTKSAFINSV